MLSAASRRQRLQHPQAILPRPITVPTPNIRPFRAATVPEATSNTSVAIAMS